MATFLFCISAVAVSFAAGRDSNVGVYRCWGGGICPSVVTLLANGNYLARWDGDLGSWGSASGSWELIGAEIHLNPKREEGLMMQGRFRILLVREMDGKKALLRKEDVKFEKNPLFYLYLEKNPNQSPEPTTTVVTPPAMQESRQP